MEPEVKEPEIIEPEKPKIDASQIESSKSKCNEVLEQIKKLMQEAKGASEGDNEFINQLLEFEEGSRKTERKFEEIETEDLES